MNAFMSCYQRYEHNNVINMNVENDIKVASNNSKHATHPSHKFDNHFEMLNTPHFTPVTVKT